MTKEIALFIRKFQNKNKPNDTMIPSRNRFYINLMFYLQEIGHKILIYDQRLFEKELSESYSNWIKKKINFKFLKRPNLPFVSKKLTNSDFEFYEHTITTNKNQNIINIKPFYLPDHYYFDKMGFSAWSEISSLSTSLILKNNINANLFFKKYYENFVLNNLSKYSQPPKKDIDLPKKYFFLPLQLADDTVNIACEHSTQYILEKFINIFSQTNENLVIKRHPKCKSLKIKKALNNIDLKNVIVLDSSIHDLISKCSAVLVNNSGVGFESLFHLKPVYTFGRSDYQIVCRNISLNDFNPSKVKPLTEDEINKIKFFTFNVLNGYVIKTNDKSSYLKAFKRVGLLN
jgi:hypothetical protein